MALDWNEIGRRNHLLLYPMAGPFQQGKSMLIGFREGLLVCFAPAANGFGVLVRFQHCKALFALALVHGCLFLVPDFESRKDTVPVPLYIAA